MTEFRPGAKWVFTQPVPSHSDLLQGDLNKMMHGVADVALSRASPCGLYRAPRLSRFDPEFICSYGTDVNSQSGNEWQDLLEADRLFAGSIPENYDRYLVPLIFAPYAADIARRAASLSPSCVLETAAGSGVATRALAPGLPRNARYVVTDLNQPMLDYATSRQPADARIEWRRADALALPFEDATFDLVCCQFGAMFFPDRTSGYREAKRVLRPGGYFLFNVWDRIERNVFANDVTNALGKIFRDDPPRFLARTPHGYHDMALIRRELEAAGFSRVAIETRTEQSRARSPRVPAVAYCQGTLLRNEIEARAARKLESTTDYVASAIADRHGRGEIAADIQAHVILAAA